MRESAALWPQLMHLRCAPAEPPLPKAKLKLVCKFASLQSRSQFCSDLPNFGETKQNHTALFYTGIHNTYLCISLSDSKAACWSRSRMPSPAPAFLDGALATPQHLTKPALLFCLTPPQKRFCESEPCPGATLPSAWPLRRNSFLCRKRGHLSWQPRHHRPGTQPLQNNTALQSPTHTGSGAVSPVEGFQLHLRPCLYHCPAPCCFW